MNRFVVTYHWRGNPPGPRETLVVEAINRPDALVTAYVYLLQQGIRLSMFADSFEYWCKLTSEEAKAVLSAGVEERDGPYLPVGVEPLMVEARGRVVG